MNEPGFVLSSSQILRRAFGCSCAVVAACGAVSGLLAYLCGSTTIALSVLIGVGIDILCSAISWFTVRYELRKTQVFLLLGLYILKLVLIIVVFMMFRTASFFNAEAAFIAFAGSVLISLITISFVIMTSRGPVIGD